VWNTWRSTPAFAPGKPWLLNFFDQIRFFDVSHDELTDARAAFPHGRYPIEIEETSFSYGDYARELARNHDSIAAGKQRQQAAFDAERQRWQDAGLDSFIADDAGNGAIEGEIPAGCFGISSNVPGNIWKILVAPGAAVAVGETVAIIESMKMEIAITAHAAGRVRDIRAEPGRNVRTGDVILVLEES
jgi:urea carboxylase